MRFLAYLFSLVTALVAFGPTHIKGVRQSETGNQDRNVEDWLSGTKYLDDDRTMFTKLLTSLSTKGIKSKEYKLFERERRSRWVRLNEAMTDSETDMDVDDGAAFNEDDVCLIPDTDEMFKVTSVSGNTLTVVRGVLGTTAVAADDDAWVKILFERQEENGRSGTPISTDYETVSNFPQIFKQTWGESNTNSTITKRGNSDDSEEKMLAYERIREDFEQAFKWGRKLMETTSGVTYRYTGGFDQFVTTNRLDAEGGLGFGDISWLVNQTTRYGGKKKIWLVGRDARMQLDTLGLEYLRIKSDENILGMAVDGVRTSFGEFMMVTDHSLEHAHADRILIVDPAHIAIAQLRGLKTEMNIQENDRDGKKHQFIAELGLWLDTERAHAVVTGVSQNIS